MHPPRRAFSSRLLAIRFSKSIIRRLCRRRRDFLGRTFRGSGCGGGEGWVGGDPKAAAAAATGASAHTSSCGAQGFGVLGRADPGRLRRLFFRFLRRRHHDHNERRRRRGLRLRRRRRREGRPGEGSPRVPAMLSWTWVSTIGVCPRLLELLLASSPGPRALNFLLSAGSWGGTEPPPRPTPQEGSRTPEPSPAATATAAAAAAAADAAK